MQMGIGFWWQWIARLPVPHDLELIDPCCMLAQVFWRGLRAGAGVAPWEHAAPLTTPVRGTVVHGDVAAGRGGALHVLLARAEAPLSITVLRVHNDPTRTHGAGRTAAICRVLTHSNTSIHSGSKS